MKEHTNRIIVVLGMHRSGTSVITHSLQLLGVGLGDNLHPAGFDNPKGFWEDRDCLEINEKLLNHLGSAYDRLDFAWECARNDSLITALKSDAKQLVIQKLTENDGLWGFKDPRTCRLLSFWRDVFDSVGCEASYVIASRNPLSVASSLVKRNNTPFEKSYYLWLQHMLPAVLDSEESPRLVVDYDLLMDAPLKQLFRISAKLRLPILDEDGDAVREYLADYLDNSLRHTKFSTIDVASDNRVPLDVTSAYQLLLSASRDESSLDSPEICTRFKDINSRLKAHTPAFSYINAIEDERITIYKSISERDGQIIRLNQALSERDGQITRLNQALSERDGQITELNQGVSERDGQITRLNQALSGRDGQITELNQGVSERDGQITRLNQALSERDGQITELNQGVSERDGQITRLNQALSGRDGQISRLGHEMETLRCEFDKIIHSKSWFISKPLRFLRRNLISRPYWFSRNQLSYFSHWCWHHLPGPVQNKQKFKNSLFVNLPFIFGWTQAYRNWRNFNSPTRVGSLDIEPQVPILAAQAIMPDNDYVPLLAAQPLEHKPVKLICFYLPQFHPIAENNAWWGEGFTEWTNVKSAKPQFAGHCQPHVPGELGYYNLLNTEVQRRQVELAKIYGIEGFCFYFYWFGGKRLLETPIENFLNDNSLSLSFCICWANENWSRRWDGLDSEVLIAQKHSPEDDLAFIRHIARYLRDPRYIRIDDKPLLLVYRPSLLPSAKETAQRWRNWCRDNEIGEIYLAFTQSFETVDPHRYGFDAAVEFPPNNSAPPDITGSVTPLSEEFACTVYDWRVFVERSEKYKKPNYKLFRGVCPSWDNTARRKIYGTVFLNNNPLLYQHWLENAVKDTVQRFVNIDERLVFINAWNEWAESAYMEPDEKYGYAWLQATRDALSHATVNQNRSILLVTHDCHPHGAQLLILEIAKQLKKFGFKVSILALDGGKLIADFDQVGHTLNAGNADETAVEHFLARLRSDGTLDAITSTVVVGRVVPQLKKLGFRVLCLIHELPGVIREMKQEANAELIARHADKVVFPAEMVSQRFREIAQVSPEKIVIRPQGVLRKNPYKRRRAEAHRDICKKHNLQSDTQIVLSIAYVDERKGPDLFVEMASHVLKLKPKTTFIWIGHSELEMEGTVKSRIKELGLQEQVLFIGFVREPMAYYAAASVYALTSREDPFPNVVLESAEVGVPVVAFQGASGASEFIVEHGGRLAGYLDTNDFARHVCDLLDLPVKEVSIGVDSLQQYTLDLLHHLNGFPRISVLVPNYNYERHITKRLDTIYSQTFPIYEVIVLDDASSDNSAESIKYYLERTGNDANVFVNDHNSGSVFRQWQKGISHSKGDLLWIAEADDLADRDFLSELCPVFQEPGLVMAYSQSKQIDDSGKIVAENYLDYTIDVSDCWLNDYERKGLEEISEALVIKNTIPNVSAVLFSRNSLEDAFNDIGDELFNYHVAGDWLVYLHVLKKGNVSFCSKSLNLHRRHTKSITKTTQKLKHLEEVSSVQAVARALSTPSRGALDRAGSYLRYLYKHFGIQEN